MKKKTGKASPQLKLHLSRETLHALELGTLQNVVGASINGISKCLDCRTVGPTGCTAEC